MIPIGYKMLESKEKRTVGKRQARRRRRKCLNDSGGAPANCPGSRICFGRRRKKEGEETRSKYVFRIK